MSMLKSLTGQRGYIMPSILMIGTALSILSLAVFEYTNSTRIALQNQLYSRMANDAAQSGVEFAFDKLASNSAYNGTDAPADCNNTNTALAPYVIEETLYCTSFDVQEVEEGEFVSKGIVYRKSGSSHVKVAEYNLKKHISAAVSQEPVEITRVERVSGITDSTYSATAYGYDPYTPEESFTPLAGSVLIAYVSTGEDCQGGSVMPADGSGTTITGGGLTWVPIVGASSPGNTALYCDVSVRAFYAIVPDTPPQNMQVTVDAGSFDVFAYTVFVHEYQNVDTSEPVSGAVADTKLYTTSNLAFSLTLTDTPAANDIKAGFIAMQGQDPGYYDNPGFAIPPGWTQLNLTTDIPIFGPSVQLNNRTDSTNTSVDFLTATTRLPELESSYLGFIIKAKPGGGGNTGGGGGTGGGETPPAIPGGPLQQFGYTSQPQAREGVGGATNGSYVYLIGGCNSSNQSTNTVQYTPINSTNGTLGTWSTTTSLPTSNCNPAATVYNNRLYVVGGNNSGRIYYASINANGTVGSWSSYYNSAFTNLYVSSMEAYNGKLYVIGGYYNYSSANNRITHLSLNTSTGAPESIAHISNWFNDGVTYCATSAIHNGRLYVSARGKIRHGAINADGTVGAATVSNLPLNRDCADLVTMGGYLYLLGGGPSTDVYYSQINTSTGAVGNWIKNSYLLPASRMTGAGLTHNGYIYYIAGWDYKVNDNAWYTKN